MRLTVNFHGLYKQFKVSSRSLLLVFTFIIQSLYGQQTQQVSTAGTKFLLYTPAGYTPSNTYPLLVTLHGQGSIGDDYNLLVTGRDETPAWLINKNRWPGSRPFIVLSPQLKRDLSVPDSRDQVWPPEMVDEVIEYVKANWSVDDDRVYLTGLSLGGAGVWTYAATYPEKIAAIVPISGVTDTTQACLLTDVPAWVFHGGSDGLVPPALSIDMVNAITECPGAAFVPKLNLLHAQRHEGWSEVYNLAHGYDIYNWFLKFTKNDASNKSPYVFAGLDLKIMLRSESFTLHGEYFDSDGTITNVAWTQVSGASLTLSGTNTKILKLDGLSAGTFEFDLSVTDNDGTVSTDRVKLDVLSSVTATQPIVTDLTLINGSTNADIGALSEGYVINTVTLGTNQFNVRATAGGTALKSVMVWTNSDHGTQTENIPGPYLIINQSSPSPEWIMVPGTYTICATPYDQSASRGNPGVTQCFTVTVTNESQTTTNYYAKQDQDISVLASWGTNLDGTGTSPASFSANNQIFNVTRNVVMNNPLTISGNASEFWMRNNGLLTINAAFNGTINSEGNATIHVNANHSLTFGIMGINTIVNFNGAATDIPLAQYGNVFLKGAGSTKVLPSGVTTVSGNLTIENDVTVNGAASQASTIALYGNLTLQEDDNFVPASLFTVSLESGAPQVLNFLTPHAEFYELIVTASTIAELDGVQTSLVLGSSAGGGLTIHENARLFIGGHNLSIVGQGGINSGNQTGQLGFSEGTLSVISQSAQHSYLYPVAAQDTLDSITIDLDGSGELFIQDTVYITDNLRSMGGTLNANGFVSLVSTAAKTARIAPIEGGGVINGAVMVQRFIPAGRFYRYMSFPVAVPVSELQDYIPITGNFTGTSTGPGMSTNPSMFRYVEPSGWTAFPQASNTELLTIGRGYSVFIRQSTLDTKVIVKGDIHQGNFNYSITPDPNPGNVNDGWNLVGNPYASPIAWGGAGWTMSGINATAYVRDNSIEGGRYLVWDGETGDEEFSGFIAQGQSFWVRSTSDTPSLVLQETGKTVSGTFFRKQEQSASTMMLELKYSGLVDRTYIKFRKGGDDNFDQLVDAVKQKNGYFNISTFSADEISLAINNVNDVFCDKQVDLLLDVASTGSYMLTAKGAIFENSNIRVYLQDTFTNSETRLQAGNPYSFQVTGEPASKARDRFVLKFTTAPAVPMITEENNTLVSDAPEGNQWLLNGIEIAGATAATFLPLASGDYQVRVTDNGCSTLSEPVTFSVTSLEEYPEGVKAFPNPAFDKIRLVGRLPSPVQYTIISVTGQVAQQGELLPSELRHGKDIDVSNLRSGVFLLRLQGDGYQQQIKLVVKL
ncbi:MAG: PKD domain-containing protein [Bacteroidota bacterium]